MLLDVLVILANSMGYVMVKYFLCWGVVALSYGTLLLRS